MKGKSRPRPKHQQPLPADAADTIRRMAAEGATQLQIGSALGMTKRRFQGYLGDPAFEHLRLAYEQGKSQDEKTIADMLLAIATGQRKGHAAACMFLLKCRHGWREYLPISDGESQQGPSITIMLPGSLPADQYLKVVEAKALPVQKGLADGHSDLTLPTERPQRP